MSIVNIKAKIFCFPSLQVTLWKVYTLSELLGLCLILKGNGKAAKKLNVLFIHVNCIKTPKRLPASMKGIQRWWGTGCGSASKGRQLGFRIQCTESGSGALLWRIHSHVVRSSLGADPSQYINTWTFLLNPGPQLLSPPLTLFLGSWPCSDPASTAQKMFTLRPLGIRTLA